LPYDCFHLLEVDPLMSRSNLAWLLGVSAVALLGLTVSYSAPPKDRNQDYELAGLVIDVLKEVDHKYVNELDPKRKRKLVEDMINGGLEHLDPHSAYINPSEYRQFLKTSKGKFGGVGIQVNIGNDRMNAGQIVVISPIVGTPAYEAGILAGDVIVKVDGKSTENMRVDEAIDMIQGDPGQKVTLTVRHEGAKDLHDIEIVRAEIDVPSVLGDTRNPNDPKEWDYFIDKVNKIALVRLVAFSEPSAADLRKVIEQCSKEEMRGLILDLRNNPGGLLSIAVEVSNLFLKEGRIVSTKGRNHRDETYDAEPKRALPNATDFPMVVLVNRYSASASEIVAAALQDHHRAVVIGERSYGKGSVQNIIRMEGDTSALKLTTASYWRPSGQNIHRFRDSKESDEWGVKPNAGFEVPLKDEERLEYLTYRRDRDVVAGKPGAATTPRPKNDKDKKPFVDRVQEKALDYLRGEIKKSNAAAGFGHAYSA
jgi:carboxyl-terminal processing protease